MDRQKKPPRKGVEAKGKSKSVIDLTESKYEWRNSKAKEKLTELFLNGTIPMEDDGTTDLKQIFYMDEEITKSGWDRFKDRFRSLREQLHRESDRAEDDFLAFQNFAANHKASTFTERGYAEWEGSEAQKQLQDDMDADKHKTTRPKDLHESHESYEDFPLEVFRGHISQEERTRKYYHTLREKGKSQGKPLNR